MTDVGTPLLYTIDQAAKLLGIGRTKVYELIGAGELRPIRLGKQTVRISRAELERFIAECAA